MISFNSITECERERLLQIAAPLVDADALSYLGEALDFFLELKERLGEENVAVCLYSGFLLARLFDGGDYFFSFPIDIVGEGDVEGACLAIADYVRKEEIPLYFCDVDEAGLSLLKGLFKQVKGIVEDGGISTVRILNEAEVSWEKYKSLLLIEENGEFEYNQASSRIPNLTSDSIALYPMRYDGDKEGYTRLVLEADTNRFWGYDPLSDITDKSPQDLFYENLKQMEDGRILSFALKQGSHFVGEALLYGFDFRGGAEVGIRLLSEYRGKGYAKRFLTALLLIAKDIGLARLFATVDIRNTPSLCFFSGYAEQRRRGKHPYIGSDVEIFTINL